MGKYMRKAKISGDVAVMEVSQSSFGVRTRAKTLALQRLHSTTSRAQSPPPQHPESCYLQLRSRRLEKPPLLSDIRKQHQEQQKLPPKEGSCRRSPENNSGENLDSRASSCVRMSVMKSGSVGSVSISCCEKDLGRTTVIAGKGDETEDDCDFGVEASFGENNLEFEARERSTRESTPCSLMRDLDSIATPGSTTRPTRATTANRRIRTAMQTIVPTMHEIEEFFSCVEQQQQNFFMEKYNFDVLNDLPLPGRYEWVKVNP
ncbi:unnamed protein product [Ilex paraguariensis]|uniref:Cyclin-dependent kinase inhibitor domain-containing protein n=1 Tax=Ilex paraguariensis TaxID=185542 RepID=A0ABC8SZ41_9AQUA